MKDLMHLQEFRESAQELSSYGTNGDSGNGLFTVHCKQTNKKLFIVASNGGGWEHVSVSAKKRCQNWIEMDFIKRLFFKEGETVIQLHVPDEDHINLHSTCLHLWRPLDYEIPRPPSFMVG